MKSLSRDAQLVLAAQAFRAFGYGFAAVAYYASGDYRYREAVDDIARCLRAGKNVVTTSIVPFCHPLPLERCTIDIADGPRGTLRIVCNVSVHHKTGVEMEALTGASIAALTIYDMCKALSHDIVIAETRLVEKRGGKSDIG